MPRRIFSDVTYTSKRIRAVQPHELRPEYAWLMAIFEDNGVAEYDPEGIWAQAYVTARPDVPLDRLRQALDEFVRVGLYEKYDAEGKARDE